MHRFFVDKSQISEYKIIIIGKDVKHIKDVLRLKKNEIIEILNDGFVYVCRIERIEKDRIETAIVDRKAGVNESKVDITLFQGLAKGTKMDFIFQKNTEIGVKEFYPIITHRSVVKIKEMDKEQKKINRWNSIVEEAAKQSKRDSIPIVRDIITFDKMIDILRNEKDIIVPYEEEKSYSIKEGLINSGKKINIIIGPEGGFEQEEIQILRDVGGKIVTLGNRILRTETAGLVASTIILYEFGDIGVV
ncbi:RsmE family RNA methyltransferase [Paratissierella segnis]|jgi:16S rRNA (uracil1498-N3)-methyltransferase|uniref:Ribosomal RNA small subunit methyltransferase E n=1 Tax=Paratissierella segnis TaxID=2763679 RepID=A0A926IFE0_9FIRM|nr:RsmE family RNA methyltransferase [Paratissierella segnis]MBC8588387.1 16S rRNA (uracil(1498)-N(3))-methyltransferase [Paratissierella segnis]